MSDFENSMFIDDISIQSIDSIPEHIIDLEIHAPIKEISNLPFGLKKLTICFGDITKIENLPPNLEYLNLGNNQIRKIEGIPSTVKVLCLSFNYISKIENLPEGLEELYISNNEIRDITKLPKNLKVLDVFCNPSRLETLYPRRSFKIENYTLPLTLKKLKAGYPAFPSERGVVSNLEDYKTKRLEMLIPKIREIYWSKKCGKKFRAYMYLPGTGVIYRMYLRDFESRKGT